MYDLQVVRSCARLRGLGLSTLLIGLTAALLAALSAAPADAAVSEEFGATTPVSVTAAGAWADRGSSPNDPVSISDDGEIVAFQSRSQNLGAAGPVGAKEGYVKNLETGEVTLATRADGVDGAPADEGVVGFYLSGDGRYAIFTSAATNLGTPLPGAGKYHVYRRDLQTGETEVVDRLGGANGAILDTEAGAVGVSANGRYVLFVSETTDMEDPTGTHEQVEYGIGYVRDMDTGTTTAATVDDGTGGALAPAFYGGMSISADGRYVAFGSEAAGVVPGGTAGEEQVYLRSLDGGTTTLVSATPTGAPGSGRSTAPTISGGSSCYVEFTSAAADLVEGEPAAGLGYEAYLADRCGGHSIELLSVDGENHPAQGAFSGSPVTGVSGDGKRALFSTAFSGSETHLYLRDQSSKVAPDSPLDRASGDGPIADNGVDTSAISANGCRAVFSSPATNIAATVPPTQSGGEPTYQIYVRQLKPCKPPHEVNVRIEGRAETLFEGEVPVTIKKIQATSDTQSRDCDGINELDPENSEPGVTPTLASVEAMESIGEGFDGLWYNGFGDYFIKQWGPDREDESAGAFWGILVNETFTNVGGCQYQLEGNDQVLWVYDAFSGRPSLALFPEAAHYESGARPTAVTAHVGEPVPVEVVAYDDNVEDIPGEEPSRLGSHPYKGASVAPVTTNAKGFQRVEAGAAGTVVTDAAGKAIVVFSTPGPHRIKATVGAPGHESVIRSNGITVNVLPDPATGPAPDASKPAVPASSGGPLPKREPARISKPKLDRDELAKGVLRIDWKVLDPGAGVKAWRIEAKALGQKGAKFRTRASGRKGSAATVHLPLGHRYKVRFALTDRAGHTTRYGLGTVTVPSGGGN
jgi:Tol biopolymer transport system component